MLADGLATRATLRDAARDHPVDGRPDRSRRGGFRDRRAKIVCTLGPATSSRGAIEALVAAGMDVARINLSHGSHDEHAAVYRIVREEADRQQRAVAVLADLQGPKIRLGTFAGGRATLEAGAIITLDGRPHAEGEGRFAGSSTHARTTHDLAADVGAGGTLLVDDGRVRLSVLAVSDGTLVCRVVEGGVISDHKGVTAPGARLRMPTLTDKDRDDLRFAMRLGVDLIALSFVRRPEDIEPVRRAMDEVGRRLPVIAKLERPESVERLEAVVEAFDGLMVARGDLGVEIPFEHLPLLQKRAVRLARGMSKPVIVATQMLDSMTHSPRPSRAEVSDVANAVLDGADALMLSSETSVGAHPVEAVAAMERIIVAAEQGEVGPLPMPARVSPDEAIAAAAAHVAMSVDAQALVAFTETGRSAQRLAGHRCPIPILAFTPHAAVRSRLALSWGIETFVMPLAPHTDGMVRQVERAMLDLGRCDCGDLIVVVAGTLSGESGCTNMIRIHRVGSG